MLYIFAMSNITSNTAEAPTRAQYINIHGSDSCFKQLKNDLKNRTQRASRVALWTTATQSYVESHVGEYIDEKLAESSTLFITDVGGHCVVTAGYNGDTVRVEVVGRNSADGSFDVVIDAEVLKSALEAEPVVADVLAELALTGKVKVNVAGRSALTHAYRRYMLEFQPVDVRDLSWLITR